MRRGEVWWVNFDPSQGRVIQKCRLAVILTINALNRARGTVVVWWCHTPCR
ncbi:MAG: type II toxin-antitoxin system PemK/MazF family toxin [Desulfovibrio sp.]|nr:type II toxin-antitoxin system PemK/MazF family toxin [Desulfovibrio sp.]